MESRKILIVQDGIVAEDKSLYRFGVKQGTVKCFKQSQYRLFRPDRGKISFAGPGRGFPDRWK